MQSYQHCAQQHSKQQQDPHQIRLFDNGGSVQQGQLQASPQQHGDRYSGQIGSQGMCVPIFVFARERQQRGRCPQQEDLRARGLCTGQEHDEFGVQSAGCSTNPGHVCSISQQEVPEVLELETMPRGSSSGCYGPGLGAFKRRRLVVQPPLADDMEGTAEDPGGQGLPDIVCADVGESTLVATVQGTGQETSDPVRAFMAGQVGKHHACTKVEDLCGSCGSLRSPDTARGLLGVVQFLSDIPMHVRLKWIQLVHLLHPTLEVDNTLRKLKLAQKRNKYDMYFDIQPLVDIAKEAVSESATLEVVRDKLILCLRLFTMARSFDVAHVVPAIWTLQDKYFIRLVDKTGKERMLSIGETTLNLLVRYLTTINVENPGRTLLRHLKDKKLALGPEAIAKTVLNFMDSCGNYVSIFKAHSVRGAVATEVMKRGSPRTWQDKGGDGIHSKPLSTIMPSCTRRWTGRINCRKPWEEWCGRNPWENRRKKHV